MTFSIVARCAETGMFGMAISSSSPAVAARCPHARAGVGAVASQNITDPALGSKVLQAMGAGASAADAISAQMDAPFIDYRQLLAVDAQGRTASHSGAQVLGVWAVADGDNAIAGGNLLANPQVPQAMIDGFAATKGHLADRLLAALHGGLAAGGEAGPVHSAGLLVVDQQSWPLVELRCDWEEACPIAHISAAWVVYKPQMLAYVDRALNPTVAPSYGVPGDE